MATNSSGKSKTNGQCIAGKAGVKHGGQTDNLPTACLPKMQKRVFGMLMSDM